MGLRCVCIGECMIEMRSLGDGLYRKGYAGDAYNTAVYLRRSLGPDDEVSFLTGIGDDNESLGMRLAFAAQGLSDRHVFTRTGERPGLYLIELDLSGERSFHYWRSTSAGRGWFSSLQDAGGISVLEGTDLLYFSGISLAILGAEERLAALALLRSLRATGTRIAFDPNLRPALWEKPDSARIIIHAAAAFSDVVMPSQDDGALLWGITDPQAQLDRWRSLGDSEVALTLGPRGALIARGEGMQRVPATSRHPVVDTSGAGDSFNGAYLAARITEHSPLLAARQGLELASIVVGHPGAIVPLDNHIVDERSQSAKWQKG